MLVNYSNQKNVSKMLYFHIWVERDAKPHLNQPLDQSVISSAFINICQNFDLALVIQRYANRRI